MPVLGCKDVVKEQTRAKEKGEMISTIHRPTLQHAPHRPVTMGGKHTHTHTHTTGGMERGEGE